MASTESWGNYSDEPFLEDNVDILMSLLEGDDVEANPECLLEDVFEFDSCNALHSNDEHLKPVSQPNKNVNSFCSVSKSHAVFSKQYLYRQRAISRWLDKRERRVFVKRVIPPQSSIENKKNVPKRSASNGRFVKSTRGFVSITEVQNCCNGSGV